MNPNRNPSFCSRITSLAVIALIPMTLCGIAEGAIGIPFTYQGELLDNSAPASGNYDVRMALYSAPSGGAPVDSPTFHAVSLPPPPGTDPLVVYDSRPSLMDILCQVAQPWPPLVEGDWPTAWNPVYLELAVKRAADPSYTPLLPRQELTPTPLAINAVLAGRADSLRLPFAATVNQSAAALEITQTGDGPAAIFKVQPQPEPPSPSPTVEVENATSAPAMRVTNTSTGPAAVFNGKVAIGTTNPSQELEVNGNIACTTLAWAGGVSALGDDQGGAIELGNSLSLGTGPYIDLHRGVGTAQDFNVRLINDADQRLSVIGKLSTSGALTVSSGDLEVSTGELRVGGNVTVASTGHVTVSSGDLEVSTGELRVGGSLTVASSGELSVGSTGTAATISATNSNGSSGPAVFASSTTGNAVHAVSTMGSAGHFEGNVHVTGNLTKAYTTGTSNRAVPIAYATIDSNGVVTAGTPNVSAVWESGNQRYVITIAGETYSTTTHITTVTPITTASPEALFATTSSGSGQLRVRIMSSSTGTTGLQKPFQFITYKP